MILIWLSIFDELLLCCERLWYTPRQHTNIHTNNPSLTSMLNQDESYENLAAEEYPSVSSDPPPVSDFDVTETPQYQEEEPYFEKATDSN